MKIVRVPEAIPELKIDYLSMDLNQILAAEEEHAQQITQWCRENGYRGPRTGEIYQEQIADGYARYLFADAGPKSVLIHLPYGDGYHDPNVKFIPRTEILKRMDARRTLRRGGF